MGDTTSKIFREIFKILYCYEKFPRDTGINPSTILDGHITHFKLPFWEYIKYPDHLWVVYIVVPYGTSLWKVVNSAEQKGAHKIVLSNEK